MEISSKSINHSSVIDILTLRYDLSLSSNLPKKSWNDFVPVEENLNLDLIENLISKNIKNNIEKFNIKKLGIALSGGVDSTLILALIRKNFPDLDIEAISIKFSNSVDETPNAAKIAEKFQANHHIVHLENYLSELPNAISQVELPFWDLHWYYVAKKSSTLSNMLASGDGGDEIFSGYTFRYEKFLSLTNDKSTPLEKVKAYLECHERDRVPDQELIFGEKSKFSWDDIHQKLIPHFDNSLSRLEQVFLADYNGKLLYNFEPVSSRLSNHFNVKVIAPLMNNELLEISPHIPTSEKYDQKSNIGKLLLRKILKQNNADKLISKQKLGFSVNTMNLWESYGRDTCKKLLSNSNIVNNGIIDNDWIQKYIDKSDLDVRYINKFLGILALEVWYKLFVSNELSSKDTLD